MAQSASKLGRQIDDLRVFVSDKLARSRAIYRLISSEDFGIFYSQVDETIQVKLAKAIEELDKDTIIDLIKKNRTLHEMTVKQLRVMCQNRNVKNYHLLTKAELLSLLESFREF